MLKVSDDSFAEATRKLLDANEKISQFRDGVGKLKAYISNKGFKNGISIFASVDIDNKIDKIFSSCAEQPNKKV